MTFNKRIISIGSFYIAFATQLLHFVTVTRRTGTYFVTSLHIANNKIDRNMNVYRFGYKRLIQFHLGHLVVAHLTMFQEAL